MEMFYNETLDIISSSDNKSADSCVVYIIIFCILIISISMVILFLFLSLFKK